MDPNNLSGKDVLVAISPLIALMIGLVFLSKGMNLAFAFVLAPLAVFYAYAFIKTQWGEIGQKGYEKEQIQKQTLRGRIWLRLLRVLDYLNLIYIGIAVLVVCLLVYGRFFANGS